MTPTLPADTPPGELLEATGQTGPPVKLVPLIEALGCQWRYADVGHPMVEPQAPDTILVPRRRANDPLIRFAIAHDLRHAALRQPGAFTDLAVPHLRERERAFDLWARQMLLPVGWFKPAAFARTPVAVLADRYWVPPAEVISRSLDLELCHLICRDPVSYRAYLRHPWWTGDKANAQLGRRIEYLTTHRYCEVRVNGRLCNRIATAIHHIDPGGYARLGRERDEDLRALCAEHHRIQHPRFDGGQLKLDLWG